MASLCTAMARRPQPWQQGIISNRSGPFHVVLLPELPMRATPMRSRQAESWDALLMFDGKGGGRCKHSSARAARSCHKKLVHGRVHLNAQGDAARNPSLLLSSGLLRRVATSRAAHEALDVLLLEAEARGVAADGLQEPDCAQLITAAFEQGMQLCQ